MTDERDDPPDPAARVQYGVLPWREAAGAIEVLLVTSRETKRWIIPKGWPMKDRGPPEAAAQEALEEAGVTGVAEAAPLGVYRYTKRLKDGSQIPCDVTVFPMKVDKEHAHWLEEGQRSRQWFPVADAAVVVGEGDLKALILDFGWSRRA